MDRPVAETVADLSSAFELALKLYTQWRTSRERANHYRRPGTKGVGGMTNCALTTSLHMGARVNETYSVGHAILGTVYARGDRTCRRALADQMSLLQHQLAVLRHATAAASGPLDINAILQASETVRIAALQALHDQYQRLAASRPDLPEDLPTPKWRSPSREEARRDEDGGAAAAVLAATSPSPWPPTAALRSPGQKPTLAIITTATATATATTAPVPPAAAAPSARWLTPYEDDAMTTAWSVLSSPLVFQSEPPSPPLTPKMRPRLPLPPPVPPLPDLVAARAPGDADPKRKAKMGPPADRPPVDLFPADPTSAAAAAAAAASSRPKNSVFHIFCPEAMALQVDVRRPVPTARKCRCGFRYTAAQPLLLKDGFSMSRRFLAKSHCERPPPALGGNLTGPAGLAGPPPFPYGCVLCTSSGVAQTYETAEDLRTHINAAHSKWQMLHDRDMTGTGGSTATATRPHR